MNPFRRFGPGLLVTAAFIGPGTITTASMAGAGFGFALLWTLVFSVFATIVLQEMSARLGLVSRAGLGEALRTTFSNPLLRASSIVLVVAAIALGNAAFETGNITGAAMGLTDLAGGSRHVWAFLVGASAFALLAFGGYHLVEKVLIVLVGVMGMVFVVTALLARPNVGDMIRGAVTPSVPPGSLLTIVALIGTTVVPYNLFLHASSVQEKWPQSVPLRSALRQARLDTVLSILLGGAITLAVFTAAASFFKQGTRIDSAAQMAEQLEPLLGSWAKWFFATGLFAAGLTSAITAPLAAAYATAGALGWSVSLKSGKFRGVWMAVLATGTVLAMLGQKPVAAILFAQAANGILLPVIAVFLIIVVNRKGLLGNYTNGAVANILGIAVVLVAAGLGAFQLMKIVNRLVAGVPPAAGVMGI